MTATTKTTVFINFYSTVWRFSLFCFWIALTWFHNELVDWNVGFYRFDCDDWQWSKMNERTRRRWRGKAKSWARMQSNVQIDTANDTKRMCARQRWGNVQNCAAWKRTNWMGALANEIKDEKGWMWKLTVFGYIFSGSYKSYLFAFQFMGISILSGACVDICYYFKVYIQFEFCKFGCYAHRTNMKINLKCSECVYLIVSQSSE